MWREVSDRAFLASSVHRGAADTDRDLRVTRQIAEPAPPREAGGPGRPRRALGRASAPPRSARGRSPAQPGMPRARPPRAGAARPEPVIGCDRDRGGTGQRAADSRWRRLGGDF